MDELQTIQLARKSNIHLSRENGEKIKKINKKFKK